VSLSRDLLLHYCAVPSLEAVRVLNLHNHGLVQMQLLDCMPELRKLVVSYNQLIRVERIAHLGHLRHLDLSHNKLTALEGLQNLACLQYLNVSWNQLDNIRGTLLVLRKHCTAISSLDLRHNCWRKCGNLRLYLLGRLKQLKLLDGQTVTEEETASALRLLLSSRVSTTMLLAHSRTDEYEPKSFDLDSTAEMITRMSRLD
jgi:Leucine-rich repeat (LRR) protein